MYKPRPTDRYREVEKYLLAYFDKLTILNLVGSKTTIDFENVRRVDLQEKGLKRKASEVVKNSYYSRIIASNQNDDVTNSHIKEWLDIIEIKDLVLCPFDTFTIATSSERSCVSISPIDIDIEDEHLSFQKVRTAE